MTNTAGLSNDDFRLPSVLKRLPQDLIGCCYYDLVHEGDLLDVSCHHKLGFLDDLFIAYSGYQLAGFVNRRFPHRDNIEIHRHSSWRAVMFRAEKPYY